VPERSGHPIRARDQRVMRKSGPHDAGTTPDNLSGKTDNLPSFAGGCKGTVCMILSPFGHERRDTVEQFYAA